MTIITLRFAQRTHIAVCVLLALAVAAGISFTQLKNSKRSTYSMIVHHSAAVLPPPLHTGYMDTAAVLVKRAKTSRDTFVLSSQLLSWLELQSRHDVGLRTGAVTVDDIVFIVMASLQKRERIATQRASWMRWAAHTLVVAEGDDAHLNIMALPETVGKHGFAEAQYRQLHGMKWLLANRTDLSLKKWFFLVDDDTWVNVPTLLDFAKLFPPSLPLSFSHVYRVHQDMAVYNGGAGMLFTHAAFQLLASAVLTNACPLANVKPAALNNDNILSTCAFETGVLKVTSSKFSCYLGEKVIDLQAETAWIDQITVHKVKDTHLAERMFCWSDHHHGQRVLDFCSRYLSYSVHSPANATSSDLSL